jgi:uncharacterized protein (DUF2062 family)
VMGSLSALAGYFGIRALWRWHVITQWERRKKLRALLAQRAATHGRERKHHAAPPPPATN